MVLVDTSVWVDFLRDRQNAAVEALDDLLHGKAPVGLCPAILQEVLQGALTQERQKALRRRFSSLVCYLPADPRQAAETAATLYFAVAWQDARSAPAMTA